MTPCASFSAFKVEEDLFIGLGGKRGKINAGHGLNACLSSYW
jgi:hypothetical protein